MNCMRAKLYFIILLISNIVRDVRKDFFFDSYFLKLNYRLVNVQAIHEFRYQLFLGIRVICVAFCFTNVPCYIMHSTNCFILSSSQDGNVSTKLHWLSYVLLQPSNS
jgi:hypothetical protein